MEQLFKNLGKWESENDRAVWNVELPKAGRYTVWLNYACPDEDAGNTWLLEAGDKTLTGKVTATGSKDRYEEIASARSTCPPAISRSCSARGGHRTTTCCSLGGLCSKPVDAGEVGQRPIVVCPTISGAMLAASSRAC